MTAATSAAAPGVPPTIDVRDFGARGDDELDDTLAIQAALDRAARLSRGTVVLPPGTYRVSDQPPMDEVALRIQGVSSFTFRGAGPDRTLLVLDSERDAHVVAVSDARNLTLEGVTVDGQRQRHRLGHGIRVASSEDVVLQDLAVRHAAHYGIGLQRGVLRRISIQRVTIDDTGGDGIDFKNTESRNDQLSLQQLVISRPGQVSPRQAAVDVRGPATLADVRIYDLPPNSAGVRFRGDNAQGLGGSHRSSLAEFEIRGDPGSVGVVVDADDVAISDGTIAGIHTGVLVLRDRTRLSAVRVDGAARHAFRIATAARGAIVERCHGRTSLAGVLVEGKATLVQASAFVDNRRCGVCIRGSAEQTSLLANTFSGNPKDVDDAGMATRQDDRVSPATQ